MSSFFVLEGHYAHQETASNFSLGVKFISTLFAILVFVYFMFLFHLSICCWSLSAHMSDFMVYGLFSMSFFETWMRVSLRLNRTATLSFVLHYPMWP